MRLSRALLVAIQWETESTFSCTFFELCAFRISIWPGGTRPAIRFKLSVVQMERLPIEVAIHLRVGEKDLRWAAFRDDMQHPGFLQLLDGLGGEDHRGVVLAPGLLRLDDVVADRLVADE